MFYIKMNGATTSTWYWQQSAQNWTTDQNMATMWEKADDANAEQRYADDYGPGEAIVYKRRASATT